MIFLKSSNSICRWKDVIEENPQIYRHFVIKLGNEAPEHFGKLKFERFCFFYVIRLELSWKCLPEKFWIFISSTSNIFSPSWNIVEQKVLRLENLETLILEKVEGWPKDRSMIVKFNQLKKLDIQEIPISKIKFIAPKLEELKMIDCSQMIHSIESFTQLRTLKFFPNNSDIRFEKTVLKAIPQKLQTLKIHNEVYYKVESLELLESQHDNLRKLKISKEKEEIEYALSKMAVEKLEILLTNHLKEKEFGTSGFAT